MRRAAKVDANHGTIVDALRRIGCSVQDLSAVGAGCPDLLVGFRGRNVLMEVKDGSKVPSARKLTSVQLQWHAYWGGQAVIVTSVDEAIAAVTVLTQPAASAA